MRENRGPWYLLTGLLIGLVAGLIYAWLVQPVQYADAAPNTLSESARDQYRAMIALAYKADSNLGRARQRLALLNDSNPALSLKTQADRFGDPPSVEGIALAALAEVYNPRPTAQFTPTQTVPAPTSAITRAPTGVQSPTATLDPALAVRTATLPPSATPTPTLTITPTLAASLTPRPTLKPSATLGAPFALKDKQKVCDAAQPDLLQVEVADSAGKPVAGVKIIVNWPPSGQDAFFTGLALNVSPGYADFQMTPKTVYAAQVGENGEIVNGLTTQDCTQPGSSATFQGGWKLKFVQP
jgi:hypothetical protein